jgi:hypothetical protein
MLIYARFWQTGWGCSSSGEDFSVPDLLECSYCGESKRVTAQFCLSCGTRIRGHSLDLLSADCPPPGGSADPAWNTPIAPIGDQHAPGDTGTRPRRWFWPPPPQVWALAAAAVAVSALAVADWRAWPPDLFSAHAQAQAAPAHSPLPGPSHATSAAVTRAPGRSSVNRAAALGPSADPSPAVDPADPGRAAGPADPGRTAGPPGGGRAHDPAAIVQGYFAAISRKDYTRAWALGGRSTNASYQSFTRGLRHTDRDSVTILSVSGPDVRARLQARETDGTVQTFQGMYVVRGGVITQFRVRQVR